MTDVQFSNDIALHIKANQNNTSYQKFIVTANFTPDNETETISVFDTGGYEPNRYHGESSSMDRFTCQIVIRSKQASSAHLVAIALYRDLDGLYSTDMNNHSYVSIEAVNPPVYTGVVDVSIKGQAHTYTLNLYGVIMRS